MIAPENNDRVIPVGTFFKGIEKSAYVHVGIGAGGEVGLDRCFPQVELNASWFEAAEVCQTLLASLDTGRKWFSPDLL